MKRVKSATFNGKTFRVHLDAIAGYVARPGDFAEIYIDPRMSTKEKFATCLHEAIHAARPEMTETEVEKLERDVAHFLLRLFTVDPKPGAWGQVE